MCDLLNPNNPLYDPAFAMEYAQIRSAAVPWHYADECTISEHLDALTALMHAFCSPTLVAQNAPYA